MIPEPLANGFCFGEGPRWFEGLLWFSDMFGEAVHTADIRSSLTTLPLPGHRPAGLGFRQDGSLLIASTESRQVLRYDGETVATIAIVVADDLDFPNGMVITPDRPLIVAESTGRRLSAFTIGGPGEPAVAVGRRHGCHPRRRPALVRKAHQ